MNICSSLLTFEAHYTRTKMWNFMITLYNYVQTEGAKLPLKSVGDMHKE